ncbi:hypothetical protein ACFX5Q_34125 [Mesorhizobium sp. IMUNJ 23033]|uniref:hypothetical protein n=1 Tax=Mesorhizobium sp. IMUNJ 23033 TaxID=3378039 RepID=UPI00384A7EE9
MTLDELVGYPFVDFEIGWGTRPLIDRAFGLAGSPGRSGATDRQRDMMGMAACLLMAGLGVFLLFR